MRFVALVFSAAAFLAFLPPVFAEDQIPVIEEGCTAPCAGYEISTELQNDWIFAADPSFLRSDVFQPTFTVDLFIAPTDFLQFATSIITEPVVDPEPGQSVIFGGIGTYVAELYTTAEAGPVAVKLGKFDTIFSLASEVAPGINATELLSNIDADERMAGEVILGFEGVGLNHTLAATVFTTDRTILSESLFTNRGMNLLSDGGAGNRGGLSSFSLAVNGCQGAEPVDCYMDGEFGYRVGFRYQKAGHLTDEDIEEELKLGNELAYLAAVTRSVELDDMTLRLIGETAYVRHFDGRPDDALVITGSAALELEPFTYIATYTRQVNFIAGGPDTHEHLADFEIIYASDDNTPFEGALWKLAAAYTFARNAEAETAHLFSVRAVFDFGGEVELGE